MALTALVRDLAWRGAVRHVRVATISVTDPAELWAVLAAVTNALQHYGADYFVTGSFASSVHGEFRATNDVDVVADIDPRNLDALIAGWSIRLAMAG